MDHGRTRGGTAGLSGGRALGYRDERCSRHSDSQCPDSDAVGEWACGLLQTVVRNMPVDSGGQS